MICKSFGEEIWIMSAFLWCESPARNRYEKVDTIGVAIGEYIMYDCLYSA
jgi:hypothetical protein